MKSTPKTHTPSTTPTWWGSLKNKLYDAYNGIVGYLKSPFIGLTEYFGQKENLDKKNVDALRAKHFGLIQQEGKKASPNYNQVTKMITEDTKKYIQTMISEEVAKLGRPPCEFSVVTLGSMARKESGPITDLEIGFIIKQKNVETYRYFYNLSQKLSDRLFLLGEHPDVGGKGLRMDEADNAPPHLRFFARNATKEQAQELLNDAVMNREWDKIPYEGSRPFLATAEEFASYSQPVFEQDKDQLHRVRREQYIIELDKAMTDPKNRQRVKTEAGKKQIENETLFWVNQMYRPFNAKELRTANDAGKKLGRNMDLLYGNAKIYNHFQTLRQRHFDTKEKNGLTLRQNFAKSKMIEDINEHMRKGKSICVTGKLGKTLDIKRELYRFAEQFVTNLGFYHHCKNQNTIDIVQELTKRNIVSPELEAKLVDYLQFATGLRLKEQSILKRQGFAAYLDHQEFEEDKTDLEKEIQQLESSIEYLEKVKHDPSLIAGKQRELVKLKSKYEHLLDMAPSKLYSDQDITLLKEKYAPMAKELFEVAKEWTAGKPQLGFAADAKAPKAVTFMQDKNRRKKQTPLKALFHQPKPQPHKASVKAATAA